MFATVSALPCAFAPLAVTANIKQLPNDFKVFEQLSFEPSGSGEHIFLLIEKVSSNTTWVADQLAKFFSVRHKDVSYAGLKDRHAVTQQWFSIYHPKNTPIDWDKLISDEFTVLKHTRHTKKLRRGCLERNRFEIILRNFQGDSSEIASRLDAISSMGVPNYYGKQRFGIENANLDSADKLFKSVITPKRPKRSIYLSAARSYLFNQVLAARINSKSWNELLPGEAVALQGSNSYFLLNEPPQQLDQRLKQFDISPSGPLVGLEALASEEDALAVESNVLSNHESWCKALTENDLSAARRALILPVSDSMMEVIEKDIIKLQFSLPTGCYATSVLREIISDS